MAAFRVNACQVAGAQAQHAQSWVVFAPRSGDLVHASRGDKFLYVIAAVHYSPPDFDVRQAVALNAAPSSERALS